MSQHEVLESVKERQFNRSMNQRTNEQPQATEIPTEPTQVLQSDVAISSPAGSVSAPSKTSLLAGTTNNLRQLSPKTIRQTRPTFWGLVQHLFVFMVLGLALVAAVVFFIQTAVGQQLDEISFNEFSYQFLSVQTQTSQMLDLIPAIAGITAVIGMIFVLLWKHRFVPALVGLSVAAAANLSSQLLKNYLITKPNFGIQEATMNSAPSGHTTFAAAAGAALFLASPKKLRPLVAVIGAAFTSAAGFSTIVNGWHRPADVITAILLTSMWTVVGLTILRFLRSEELDLSDTHRSGLILIPLLTIGGFFLGFCSLALYVMTYYNPIPGGALIASSFMMLTVIAFTTAAEIALLRTRNKARSAYTKIWTY